MRPRKNKTIYFFSKSLNNSSGFSLLEILIALFLGASMYGLYTSSSFSQRDNLNQTSNYIERAIRFGADESAIKNRIIRLHLLLDKDPQELTLELGPDGHFVLPADNENTKETKDDEPIKDEQSKNFQRITEFDENNYKLSGITKIIGIGTNGSKGLTIEGHGSLFIYPTGEKDSALIILGSDEELLTLEVNSFMSDFVKTYYPLSKNIRTSEELETSRLDLAKKVYTDWMSSQ